MSDPGQEREGWIICRECREGWPESESGESSCECSTHDHFFRAVPEAAFAAHAESPPQALVAAARAVLAHAEYDDLFGHWRFEGKLLRDEDGAADDALVALFDALAAVRDDTERPGERLECAALRKSVEVGRAERDTERPDRRRALKWSQTARLPDRRAPETVRVTEQEHER